MATCACFQVSAGFMRVPFFAPLPGGRDPSRLLRGPDGLAARPSRPRGADARGAAARASLPAARPPRRRHNPRRDRRLRLGLRRFFRRRHRRARACRKPACRRPPRDRAMGARASRGRFLSGRLRIREPAGVLRYGRPLGAPERRERAEPFRRAPRRATMASSHPSRGCSVEAKAGTKAQR